MGEEGDVDGAAEKMKMVDILKREKEDMVLLAGVGISRNMQNDKRMKVCEICGAFLVVGDTENRQKSHLDGKQHLGFLKIREKIEELKVSTYAVTS